MLARDTPSNLWMQMSCLSNLACSWHPQAIHYKESIATCIRFTPSLFGGNKLHAGCGLTTSHIARACLQDYTNTIDRADLHLIETVLPACFLIPCAVNRWIWHKFQLNKINLDQGRHKSHLSHTTFAPSVTDGRAICFHKHKRNYDNESTAQPEWPFCSACLLFLHQTIL